MDPAAPFMLEGPSTDKASTANVRQYSVAIGLGLVVWRTLMSVKQNRRLARIERLLVDQRK